MDPSPNVNRFPLMMIPTLKPSVALPKRDIPSMIAAVLLTCTSLFTPGCIDTALPTTSQVENLETSPEKITVHTSRNDSTSREDTGHVQDHVSMPSSTAGRTRPWISAYLASWEHNAGTPYTNWGSLTADEIDWSAMTHLFYFAMNVAADGRPGESLDPRDRYNFTTDRFLDIVPAAHAHGTHILFSIGGAGNYEGFSAAISRELSRQRLIDTILGLLRTYGFDGVDIDMEPIRDSDVRNYSQFIRQLHAELALMRTRQGHPPLLTAAINGQFDMFADLQDYFDQINLMTYDLSGPWRRWQAWHNSALFSTDIRFESTGGQMPSIDLWVNMALQAGLRPEKIGIGIDFYGYIWNGVYEPLQGWGLLDPPTLEREGGGNPYREIAARFDLSRRKWDPVAQVPYLSLRDPDRFVSYDDEHSIARKLDYIIDRQLGGAIVWELSGTHLPGNEATQWGGPYLGSQTQVSDPNPLLGPIRVWLEGQRANASSEK